MSTIPTYDSALATYKAALSGAYSLDYQTLRRAVASKAKKLGRAVVPNYKKDTLRAYVAGEARKQLDQRVTAIEKQRAAMRELIASRPAPIAATIEKALRYRPAFAVENIAKAIKAVKKSTMKAEREGVDRLIRTIETQQRETDAAEVFNRHTTYEQIGETHRIHVNVNAIYSDIYGANYANGAVNPIAPVDMVAFGDNAFGPWIMNMINRIHIPANKQLFILRRDMADGAYVLWTAWKTPTDFIVPEWSRRRFHWLGAVLYGDAIGANGAYTLEMRLVEPRRVDARFEQVGYNFYNHPGEKNCLVRILSPYVPAAVRERFDEMTAHLVHKQDSAAYIDDDFIDRLGKLMRAKILLYSPYGAIKNTPTQVLGSGGNKKHFKVIVRDKHACVFAPSVVNKVNYINSYEDYKAAAGSSNLSTVIEADTAYTDTSIAGTPFQYARDDPENPKSAAIAGFITVDGFGKIDAVTTMHKYLRPSIITGRADDDENPALFSKTTPAGVFVYNFIRKHELTAPPQFIQELASIAGKPFGTAHFNAAKKNTQMIEIDQNASYASFEFSRYYNGFPVGNFMKRAGAPMQLEDPELLPAFIEVRGMQPRETAAALNYWDALALLRENISVITYPEYVRFSEFFDIDVINTTYATFKRISLYEDLREIAGRLPSDIDALRYIKTLRNTFTGKLIQGGLYTYNQRRTVTTTDKNEFEIMLGEIQRDTGEVPHAEIIESPIGNRIDYKIHFTTKKAGHRYPHIYSYITALSRLSVLDKILELKSLCYKVMRVHVDAIYVRKPSHMQYRDFIAQVKSELTDIDDEAPGKFKVHSTSKAAETKKGTPHEFVYSQADVCDNGYPGHRKIVIIGPGGVGKSTVAVNHAAVGRALYLTPTKELRAGMREKLTAAGKDPKDCICLEGIRRAVEHVNNLEGRKIAPKYAERLASLSKYCTVFIDEYCKTDGKHLRTVVEYMENQRKNIIMMGDYNQTIFAPNNVIADRKTLTEWGFLMFADPRNARAPGKPMRHSYEWGTFLDSIAERPSCEQVAELINYGIRTQSAEYELLDANGIVYCGSWKVIGEYNGARLADNSLKKIKDIKTGEVFDFAENHRAAVWNKSSFTETAPRGKKYTINYAITIDSVQGSTVENPIQYIHVNSLISRKGAIYTAVTRSREPGQIILLM